VPTFAVMEWARQPDGSMEMIMSKRSINGMGLVLTTALLSACGGGGGGSAPVVVIPDGPRVVAASADSDATAANFGTLGAPLARAVLGGSSSGLLDPIGGAGASPQSAATAVALVQAPTLTGRTALAWLRHVGDPDRKRIAAVMTEVLPCTFGGSITVSFDDVDNDNELSAGDSIGFLAQNCIDDPGLPAANGGFTMRINAVELDGQGEPTALDVSGTFDAFTLAGYGSVDGAFRLWTRQETAASTRLRVSYQRASVTETSGTVLYDYDIDGLENAAGGSFEISGGLGLEGRTYAVSTPVRLQYAFGQAPAIGQVDLRDMAGDAVQLVARSATSFDLGFLPAGSAL
jgi:hypothetical protein